MTRVQNPVPQTESPYETSRRIDNIVRMVPMQEIAHYRQRLERVIEDQAELRLSVDIAGRHAGIRKGLYADPFLNDSMRDAGQAQTAAIAQGALRLPLHISSFALGLALTERQALAHGYRAVLSQPMRTASMLVNPYAAFDPLPGELVLKPAIDRWTEGWYASSEIDYIGWSRNGANASAPGGASFYGVWAYERNSTYASTNTYPTANNQNANLVLACSGLARLAWGTGQSMYVYYLLV